MGNQFNKILPDIVNAINNNYTQSDLLLGKSDRQLPVRSTIIEILDDLKQLLFPGYFSTEHIDTNNAAYYTGQKLSALHHKMKKQIALALAYDSAEDITATSTVIQEDAETICCNFLASIPTIQEMLLLLTIWST